MKNRGENRRRRIGSLLLIAFGAIACSHSPEPRPPQKPPQLGIEIPAVAFSDTLIYNEHGRYTFLYSSPHRQARWVAYKLTRDDVDQGAGRASSFKVDSRLAFYGWTSAVDNDYKNSGYDRGHLLPSADRSASVEENKATFLFSNVSPQRPRLNQQTWKNLEEELRRQTSEHDTLYIVTGGVLERGLDVIGSGVSVPKLFFKAVVLRSGEAFTARGYVMRNCDTLRTDFRHYAVSLDSVERLTGLRLFPRLEGLLY